MSDIYSLLGLIIGSIIIIEVIYLITPNLLKINDYDKKIITKKEIKSGRKIRTDDSSIDNSKNKSDIDKLNDIIE